MNSSIQEPNKAKIKVKVNYIRDGYGTLEWKNGTKYKG